MRVLLLEVGTSSFLVKISKVMHSSFRILSLPTPRLLNILTVVLVTTFNDPSRSLATFHDLLPWTFFAYSYQTDSLPFASLIQFATIKDGLVQQL